MPCKICNKEHDEGYYGEKIKLETCKRCNEEACFEHYQGNLCVACMDWLFDHPCQIKKEHVLPIRLIDL